MVGPRPALAWEARLYREDEARRFDVLPGITGLWQVSGRNRLSMRRLSHSTSSTSGGRVCGSTS